MAMAYRSMGLYYPTEWADYSHNTKVSNLCNGLQYCFNELEIAEKASDYDVSSFSPEEIDILEWKNKYEINKNAVKVYEPEKKSLFLNPVFWLIMVSIGIVIFTFSCIFPSIFFGIVGGFIFSVSLIFLFIAIDSL